MLAHVAAPESTDVNKPCCPTKPPTTDTDGLDIAIAVLDTMAADADESTADVKLLNAGADTTGKAVALDVYGEALTIDRSSRLIVWGLHENVADNSAHELEAVVTLDLSHLNESTKVVSTKAFRVAVDIKRWNWIVRRLQ